MEPSIIAPIYKDSEPFWNFFPPRRKAFFVCFICYGCPFIRRRTNSGLVSADSVPWSEGEPPASYGSSRLIIGGSGVGNFRRCWRLRQRLWSRPLFWSQRVLNDLPLTVKKWMFHLPYRPSEKLVSITANSPVCFPIEPTPFFLEMLTK